MLGTLVTRRFRPALLLVLVVGFIVAMQVTPAFAAAIVVDNNADGTLAALAGNGFCDLREAVEAANTNAAVDACIAGDPGADTISFAANYTITLVQAAGQLIVDDTPLSITGPVTIDGGRTGAAGSGTRVFLVGGIVTNDTVPRTLNLSGVVVRNGRPNTGVLASSLALGAANGNGGCIYVGPFSTISMSGSTIGGTSTVGCRSANGAGIYADENSTVTITGASLVSGNQASTNGGGVAISTGFITVDQDSCIQSNTASAIGGGIFAGDTVFITVGGGSTSNRGFISGNSANGGGGGIYMDTNSTFVGNHARFFDNSSFGPGSAWFSQGGSSSSNGADVGRSCINCCIVSNDNSTYAVYQEVAGLIAQWQGNWWGNDWGPRIYDLDPAQSDTTIGSAVSNGDGISGDGSVAVDVDLTDDGSWNNPAPTGSWLTLGASNVPSDCVNDVCTGVSSVYVTRNCTVVKAT